MSSFQRSNTADEAPKTAQEAPKTAPRRAKTAPRLSKGRPGQLQTTAEQDRDEHKSGSRRPPETCGRAPGPPKGFQHTPDP
eukprot:558275-Pyramimonas_sp.AAC.1